MLRCEPNDLCVIIGGQVENIGAFVTVIEYSAETTPKGWVFDQASRPLLTKEGGQITHSFGAMGGFYVIADSELQPIRGVGQQAAAVIGVSSHG